MYYFGVYKTSHNLLITNNMIILDALAKVNPNAASILAKIPVGIFVR
jgi:hypothetical protein